MAFGGEEKNSKLILSFMSTVNVLQSYKEFMDEHLSKSCNFIESMNPEYRKCLTNYHRLLHTIRAGVNQNYFFLRLVIERMPRVFGSMMYIPPVFHIDPAAKPSLSEMEEVFLILGEMRREWSAEGQELRDEYFLPLLERAEELFPTDRQNVRVLIPGQRLGRFVFEFVKRGFRCEGQDNSFLRFACAHFMLDNRMRENEYTIHPFLHCSKNYLQDEHRTRSVTFPDENPRAILSESNLCSTFLGDFIQCYGNQSGEWHLIVTCSFLHTVMDSIECFKVIFKCLRPGGYWLNFGPLVSSTDKSDTIRYITPSHEDLMRIVRDVGFIVLEEETMMSETYCQHSLSMRHKEFKNVRLACRKRTETEERIVKDRQGTLTLCEAEFNNSEPMETGRFR